jgi:uncharacterized protein (TIGR02001 family)
MKKLLIAAAALAVAAGLRAEEPKSSYSVTADFSYATKYVFRGFKQTEDAFQPSVTVASGGFTAGLWSSMALTDKKAGWAQGREYDVFASYAIPVDKATITFGGTAYLYPSARPSLGEDDKTYELSAGVALPVGPLSGSATYFHDMVLDSNTFEFGLGYSVGFEGGSFDVKGTYGFNDIEDGNGDLPGTGGVDYRYWAVSASLSYKVAESVTAKAGVTYTGVNKVADAPKHFLGTAGLTVAF